MKGFLLFLGAVIGSFSLQGQASRSGAPVSVIPDPVKSGQELAARLRASAPMQEAEFTGRFVITTEGGRVTEVPLASVIQAGQSNWQVVYQTYDNAGAVVESLRIVHTPQETNAYFFTANAASHPPVPAGPSDLIRPFGGSDFWLMDLGLEFFHWPRQKLLRHEMRRTRPCYVLESTLPNPLPGQYGRVLSWIDTETSGLIRAEAFASTNSLVKEFNVGKFRKIDGQWQLQDMKITSEKTGQETELKFDLRKK
jgi:hypothetical protein